MSVGHLSPNCAAAQGKPAREHVCYGCPGCYCHTRRPPANFRDRVRRARDEARTRRQTSGPGPDDAGDE